MICEKIIQQYRFEKLTDEHDLSNFDCGNENLNRYLKNEALKQQEGMLNLTTLVMYENEIIGYFSLLTDSFKVKEITDEKTIEEIKNKKPSVKNVPAVKIGRLAIDKKYRNCGIGTHVLRNIINDILYLSKNIVGVRFITVDGLATAYHFYTKKNKFEILRNSMKKIDKIDKIIKQNPNQILNLYLDLERVEI